MNRTQRWASMLARIAVFAGGDDIGRRVRAALGQRDDVILCQPPFASPVAIGATVIKRDLQGGPLVSREVVDRCVGFSRASSSEAGLGLFRVRFNPCTNCGLRALWIFASVALAAGLLPFRILSVVFTRQRLQVFLMLGIVHTGIRAFFAEISSASNLLQLGLARENFGPVRHIVTITFGLDLVWIRLAPCRLVTSLGFSGGSHIRIIR